ncbi:MAG: glycosyl hydrolase family 18 protein [Nitrospinota bacterium]
MSRAGLMGVGLGLLVTASPGLSAPKAAGPMPVGLWLKHAWMEEERNPKELKALADHLIHHGATSVFVHIGPYDAEGRLTRYKPEVVRAWLASLKRHAPAIKRLGWLGGRARTAGGTVNLASAAYRQAMVDETAQLLERFEFDGIHLNIEPLEEADPDFVLLLQALRGALGTKVISFAAPKLRPWWVPGVFGISERYWSQEAFARLMPHLDQLVVMAYDTAIPTEGLYQRYVAAHVTALRQAYQRSGRPPCQLLVGLPTYDEATRFHRPEVEHLEGGLIGLLRGITTSSEPAAPPVGVAIYANWTTDESEWETFHRLWLDRFSTRH